MTPLIAMFATWAPAEAGVGDYVLVVNARNPTASVSVDELKKIYLGQTAFWHGVVPMHVVMWPTDSKAGSGFLEHVLATSAQKYDRTWASKQLSGQGIAPAVASSVDLVVTAVSSRPGAIGYMLASEAWTLPDTVKSIPITQ